jgi:hypothetical protein
MVRRMTSSPEPDVTEAERLLREAGAALTDPRAGECLLHYLRRMLDQFGCYGHRFTERWARGRRVRGRPVLQWAVETGGCCCDCEVILNSLRRRSSRRRGLLCQRALQELEAADAEGRW